MVCPHLAGSLGVRLIAYFPRMIIKLIIQTATDRALYYIFNFLCHYFLGITTSLVFQTGVVYSKDCLPV